MGSHAKNSIGPTRSDELRRRHRRIFWLGLLASLVVHALLVLLFRAVPVPRSPFAAAGPDNDDARAAAGGGLQVVVLRATPPVPEEPVVPVPVPVPEPEPRPEPEPEPEVSVESPQIDSEGTPGLLGEGAADEGPGTEEGTGQGDAGTTEEGRLRVQPPTPRGLILPPSDRPRSVRGKEVAVWVFVSARGQVVEDSTRVIPSSGDRGFDQRLRELATEWVFNPATKAGSPIAEWFRYILVL